MKKRIFALCVAVLMAVMSFSVFAESEYSRLQDIAEILSETENTEILAKLDEVSEKHGMDIAILTVPKEFAQETAQTIANIGIKGLWNFTSTELDLKVHGIMVENVHMGDSLMRLMYEINNNEQLNET